MTLKHFKHRLRKKPFVEDTEEVAKVQEDTFLMRIEESKHKKSPPFSIGSNLKDSLLMMFNSMKDNMFIPDCLRTAHVTIIHEKNCRTDLSNCKGIFVCSVLRSI